MISLVISLKTFPELISFVTGSVPVPEDLTVFSIAISLDAIFEVFLSQGQRLCLRVELLSLGWSRQIRCACVLAADSLLSVQQRGRVWSLLERTFKGKFKRILDDILSRNEYPFPVFSAGHIVAGSSYARTGSPLSGLSSSGDKGEDDGDVASDKQ